MTTEELIKLFSAEDSQGLSERSKKKDMDAFMLLYELVPSMRNILSHAEHDQVWLSVSMEELATSAITEEQVLELRCCGVWYDRSSDGLSMFV